MNALRQGLAIVSCLGFASLCFGQVQNLPGNAGVRVIQKPGLGAFNNGVNGFNGGLNNNFNAFNNFNNANAFNPGVNPFMNGPGGFNSFNTPYNPYANYFNSGFANPTWGMYPPNPQYNGWSPYNQFISPWNSGYSPYGYPYGTPLVPGVNYPLPPWYNGVSPAPIVGVSGPPFGFYPGVR